MSPVGENGAGTRERIVAAGLRLFAEGGFLGTTVGEIEEAAGLTPRAGALYKHFESKEAVLAAAVDENVRDLEAIHSAIDLMPLGDLRAELTLLARWGLHTLAQQRELRRIMIAEGDRFPELKERFRERIVDRAYAEGATFVRRKIEAGDLRDADAEAMAALMVVALLGYTVEQDVFGRPPAGVVEERFVKSLVDTCAALATSTGKETDDG
jgi:AcrR family transcriptional regulator